MTDSVGNLILEVTRGCPWSGHWGSLQATEGCPWRSQGAVLGGHRGLSLGVTEGCPWRATGVPWRSQRAALGGHRGLSLEGHWGSLEVTEGCPWRSQGAVLGGPLGFLGKPVQSCCCQQEFITVHCRDNLTAYVHLHLDGFMVVIFHCITMVIAMSHRCIHYNSCLPGSDISIYICDTYISIGA